MRQFLKGVKPDILIWSSSLLNLFFSPQKGVHVIFFCSCLAPITSVHTLEPEDNGCAGDSWPFQEKMAKAKRKYHRAMQQNGPPRVLAREETSWLEGDGYWLSQIYESQHKIFSITLFSSIQARIEVWEQIYSGRGFWLFCFFRFFGMAPFFAVVNLHLCGARERFIEAIPRYRNPYQEERWKGLGLSAMLCWWQG